MEILITNDDGINAPGINILAHLMQSIGHVTMVAPDGPRSGQSSALTVNEPIRMKLVDDTPQITRYVSTGTPADCVKLAMNQLYKDKRLDLPLCLRQDTAQRDRTSRLYPFVHDL